MPGIVPAEFENPLRFNSKPRVIDVFLDIILPELASRLDRSTLVVRQEYIDAVEEGRFTDPEAEYVKRRTDRGALPRFLLPTGGEMLDVTWAFNQATGARPEQWEVDEVILDGQTQNINGVDIPLDPLTGQPVFPINDKLPSLNRQPGIIFVPAGWFPIVGSIILFGGQQIVGVAATEGGSVLVKYGDGACITTQSPTDLVADRHMTASRAMGPNSLPSQNPAKRAPMLPRQHVA